MTGQDSTELRRNLVQVDTGGQGPSVSTRHARTHGTVRIGSTDGVCTFFFLAWGVSVTFSFHFYPARLGTLGPVSMTTLGAFCEWCVSKVRGGR
jgi:hypothetical protein